MPTRKPLRLTEMRGKLKLIVVNVLVLISLLGCVELVLFAMGYQPGIIEHNNNFKKVSELKILDGYTCDEAGIMKVNASAQEYLKHFISKPTIPFKIIESYNLFRKDCHHTPYRIGRDYWEIKEGVIKNAFSDYLNKTLNNGQLSDVDKAYVEYVNSPINKEGFRSIEFKNYTTSKPKIMLLGDSFTWGHTTKNKTNSFADLLATKDYVVFNTGIVGADLPQYHAIAKKYIPKTEPSCVVVNLFLGNDISKHDRQPSKDIPIFYPTNAGNLYSTPMGVRFESAQEAYDNLIEAVKIPDNHAFNIIMASTRLTTQLWSRLEHSGVIEKKPSSKNIAYWKKVDQLNLGYSVNRKYLDAIHALCKANNAQLIVSIIPERDNIDIEEVEVSKMLDGFISSYKIKGLEHSDYAQDGHFNEKGHEKYAAFIDQLINALESK